MMTVEERTVLLYDTPCTITISHPSKTVWVAVGDYRGERIEVKGSSAMPPSTGSMQRALEATSFARSGYGYERSCVVFRDLNQNN
jgi:hypothetical protein